ncbi:MerR family DNA-binding transcriptional regulator [Pseudoruegeria sp. SK021]|uniref:MerR family transcriptional regulator n=1 Tax=Pseudoruegeria sp. SK021 TaxID=1933035 RepID=UPI001F0B0C13|nr:MerR family DNA-binding transcriptional regulator [Pseudoruegeria sp. SK021]
MTIREMCEAFEVTPRTLRFYESKELLSPIREGQKRLFTRRDRARLKLILQGKRFGFSLEEIRQLLDLYKGGQEPEIQITEAIRVGTRHLEEMQAQHSALTAAIKDLRDQLDAGEQRLAALRGQQHAAE